MHQMSLKINMKKQTILCLPYHLKKMSSRLVALCIQKEICGYNIFFLTVNKHKLQSKNAG